MPLSASKRAEQHNQAGLVAYGKWELETAVSKFQQAIKLDSANPEQRLNLVRAYARAENYAEAMNALGDYLRVETNEKIADHYEQLFSTALDDVEIILTGTMPKLDFDLPLVGKGMHMWFEYQLTFGRRPFRTTKPQLWAAALTYAVAKVNFLNLKLNQITKTYEVSDRSVKEKYRQLVKTLDLMPADYRYFTGEENPLDKLVEAAELLETIERQFKEE